MKLSAADVERFYTIWKPLLAHVNAKAGLFDDFDSEHMDTQQAVAVRDTLWKSPSYLDGFVTDNPARLAAPELALAKSWGTRVAGKFFVLKHLKKYSVFVDDTPPAKAYGVLGIASPIESLLLRPPPVLIETVLIPFEGKIIYDSLLTQYQISFGGGIRSNLAYTYRGIQERGAFIDAFVTDVGGGQGKQDVSRIKTGNALTITAFGKFLATGRLSLKTVQKHCEVVEGLATCLLSEDASPRSLCQVRASDIDRYAGKSNEVFASLKRFVRFLKKTGRLDADGCWDLQDMFTGR